MLRYPGAIPLAPRGRKGNTGVLTKRSQSTLCPKRLYPCVPHIAGPRLHEALHVAESRAARCCLRTEAWRKGLGHTGSLCVAPVATEATRGHARAGRGAELRHQPKSHPNKPARGSCRVAPPGLADTSHTPGSWSVLAVRLEGHRASPRDSGGELEEIAPLLWVSFPRGETSELGKLTFPLCHSLLLYFCKCQSNADWKVTRYQD